MADYFVTVDNYSLTNTLGKIKLTFDILTEETLQLATKVFMPAAGEVLI